MAESADLWCRAEEDAGGVRGVNVMHPNGQILFSFPADQLDPGLVRRIRAGQVRARVRDEGPQIHSTLEFLDEAGRLLFRESVEARWTTEPKDDAER